MHTSLITLRLPRRMQVGDLTLEAGVHNVIPEFARVLVENGAVVLPRQFVAAPDWLQIAATDAGQRYLIRRGMVLSVNPAQYASCGLLAKAIREGLACPILVDREMRIIDDASETIYTAAYQRLRLDEFLIIPKDVNRMEAATDRASAEQYPDLPREAVEGFFRLAEQRACLSRGAGGRAV